ncbi:hypothetical protein ACFQ60_44870 [Streptomyces zhihengii]
MGWFSIRSSSAREEPMSCAAGPAGAPRRRSSQPGAGASGWTRTGGSDSFTRTSGARTQKKAGTRVSALPRSSRARSTGYGALRRPAGTPTRAGRRSP